MQRRVGRALILVLASLLGVPAFAGAGAPIGRWVSEREGVRRVLVLRADGSFQLDTVQGERSHRYVGGYGTDGDALVMHESGAEAPFASVSFSVTATRLTITSEGEAAKVYVRDQGRIVGRWVDTERTTELVFDGDGTYRHPDGDGKTVRGEYDVSYDEPQATVGSLVMRAGGQDPRTFRVEIGDVGRSLSLTAAGESQPAVRLERAGGASRTGGPVLPEPTPGPPPEPAPEPAPEDARRTPGESQFAGRWRATSNGRTVDFEIVEAGGFLTITVDGESSRARISSPGRAEGADAVEGGTVEFVFTRRGERLVGRFTTVSEDGTRAPAAELVFDRLQGDAPAPRPSPEPSPSPSPRPTPSPAPAGDGFAGRWKATTDQGTSTLQVEDRGGGVFALTAGGQTSVGRLTAEGRIEGSDSSDQGTVSFVVERVGARLSVRFTVVGADGRRVEAPAVMFDRSSGEEATGGERDPAVLGTWQFANVEHFVMNVNLVLRSDGTYRFWIEPSDEGPETGAWKTADRVLYLRADGAGDWRVFGRYATTDSVLLITLPDGRKRPYQRQGG